MTGLPSPPSDSPPLKPSDSPVSSVGRKRQRSQSMESDTSNSSSKRVADTDRSPKTEQLSTLSLSDSNGMEAYIAEQGTEDMDMLTLTPSTDRPPLFSAVSPDEKLIIIERLMNMPMSVGETWYLVDSQWLKRWKKACTGQIDKEGSITEQQLGPVDNSALLDEWGHLKPSLSPNVDIEFLPQEAWTHMVTWYGEPRISLPRQAIERGLSKQVSLELHPPCLKVLRMTNNVVSVSPAGPFRVVVSSQDTLKALCQRFADIVYPNFPSQTEYRVWKVDPHNDFDGPAFSHLNMPSSSPTLIDPTARETVDSLGIQALDAFVVEFQENNHWLYDTPSKPLFDSNDNFFNKLGKPSTQSLSGLFFGPKVAPSYSNLTNGRNPPPSKALVPGTLGLGNMGNTCFMNSALQCLAHNKELTDYFLTGVFDEELNPDNPLGMQGAIAQAYGALIERIWATSGPATSYSPREFKNALQRFAPQFHGYQQHDSQELVAFLLDGLHEDLNRVLKKPYVEKPDWEGGGDSELVQLARTSWEGYMKRNDSVIVDLFQGQYQSTLVCPECQKVSITFDPFMYLTLPLPVTKKWKHEIYYVPWDHEKKHVIVPVEIGRDASLKDLRALLGRWMGVNPDNLLTLEIFQHKFYKALDDNVFVGDVGDNDNIVCYELPCHARQNRNYKKKSDDPFIIAIYLSDAKEPSGFPRSTIRQHDRQAVFGYPHIAVIPQEKARSYNDIYATIVQGLSRWTDHAKDLYHLESDRPPIDVPINGAPISDSVTEINENGDVITVEEGDIAEEKITRDTDDMEEVISITPKHQVKKELFTIKIMTDLNDFGSHYSHSGRPDTWESRMANRDDTETLLADNDTLYLMFDEHMKAYYFGDDKIFEHARWARWEKFIHPEYEAAQKASLQKQSRGITLQDCLDEFTKEEQLGQDDLWYCPACKKHQQATKRFDLWKVPDILVVHLKRFSNSRTLRDKIDTLVDFPIDGLDLSNMVGERKVLKNLVSTGVVLEDVPDLDEPLIYDLFAVDEHLGGLGGGHYKAYALNHLDNRWYHFDDASVTPTQATDAVNANAYLLFYRRRSTTPLGGKSHIKTEEARHKPKSDPSAETTSTSIDTQLPTPPNEPLKPRRIALSPAAGNWPDRHDDGAGSLPSPADELPSFENSPNNELIASSLHEIGDFPSDLRRGSPTSSLEAEGEVSDLDDLDTSMSHQSPAWTSDSDPMSRDDDIDHELDIRPQWWANSKGPGQMNQESRT